MLTKPEQELIERLKDSGRTIRQDLLDAPFKFLIRPVTTVGVDRANLSSLFEDEIFAEVKETKFESPISAIVVSPIIFDKAIAIPPADRLTFQRSEKSIFSCLNIEFRTWTRASPHEKLELLSDNIKRSIDKVPSHHLSDADRVKLHGIVARVQARLASRLTH